jgi:hypothetical protein
MQLVAPTKSVGVDLRSMNGMRTLSLIWIIVGHTFLYSTAVGYVCEADPRGWSTVLVTALGSRE